MIPGKSHLGMTGPGTMPRSPMRPRAKVRKARRAKEKAKYGKNDGKDGKGGLQGWKQPILQILPKAAQPLLPQRLSTPAFGLQ